RIPELADQPGFADVEVALRLEVATDGSVTLHPEPALAGAEMPVPLRREPITEPIVLEASRMTETVVRRRMRRRKRVQEFELGDSVDPTRPTPALHLDRRPLTEPTAWEPEQTVGVGRVLLDRTEVTLPDASLSP